MNVFHKIISALKESNLIRRRIKLTYFIKLADVLNDLKNQKELHEFFRTQDEAKQNLEFYKKNRDSVKFNNRNYDWYIPTGNKTEFYVYQDPPLGVSNPLCYKCILVELRRSGHNEPVTLVAEYNIDDNGNELEIIDYSIFRDEKEIDVISFIQNFGITIDKKLCLTGDKLYQNFVNFNQYVKQQIDTKNKELID